MLTPGRENGGSVPMNMIRMNIKAYLWIRVTIVLVTAAVLVWLHNGDLKVNGGEIGEFSCQPLGWTHEGSPFSALSGSDVRDSDVVYKSLETIGTSNNRYYQVVADNINSACESARADRRMYFNAALIAGGLAFLSQAEKGEQPQITRGEQPRARERERSRTAKGERGGHGNGRGLSHLTCSSAPRFREPNIPECQSHIFCTASTSATAARAIRVIPSQSCALTSL
mgnify:CR=1 FL=1